MQITKVLGSRVLVKVFAEVTPTNDSGLVVAPQSVNPSYFTGEIIALGTWTTPMLNKEDQSLKVGDKVAFTKYGYEDMGEGQYLVEENSLLAVYE